MRNRLIYLTTLWVILFISCKEVNEIDLIGNWKAVEVLEEGAPLSLEVQEITIDFQPTHYKYASTLKYKEAGTYRIQSKLLFTKDTLQKEAVEKAVEIAKIDGDSLFLRMNEKGRERLLKLVRVKMRNEK